ncbi:MAG: ComEA family DNA-binding protein [Thermomicrobiales bacterium]
MNITRIGLAIIAFIAAVVAVFAIVRAIDERSAPAIIIDNTLVAPNVVVDLRGAVAKPGVYELPAGSRLDDAIVAAGGLTDAADLSQINLAQRVQDGAVVSVPALLPGGEDAAGAESTAPAQSAPGSRVNINTASAAELDSLPGIGEVSAGRIIQYREANGPYRSIDDLVHVQGISMSTINKLRDLVTTGP